MFRVFQHPETGRVKEVKVGYCWTVFFFGIIPMLCRGDWQSAIISYLIALILVFSVPGDLCYLVAFLFYFVIAFEYNNYYANKLIRKGFKQIN